MQKSETEQIPLQELSTISDEALVSAHQAGDTTAFEHLFKRYGPLVKNRASESATHTLPYDDLLQEGMVGLFKAVQAFDEQKAVPFAAFATTVVEHQIADAVKREQRVKNRILSNAVSLQTLRDDESEGERVTLVSKEDLLQRLIVREHDAALQKQLRAALSAKEYEVLNLRVKGYSYEQIAASRGLSSKQVDNSLQRAKRKLKAAAFLE